MAWLQLAQQRCNAFWPAANPNRATGKWLFKVVHDVQHMHLAVSQFPRQVKGEAMVTGGAICQCLVVGVAGGVADYLITFTHSDLHVAVWRLRVPRPARNAQPARVPHLGGKCRRLLARAGG
ncbi:hypothetical protein PPUJ13061_42170 [Pseudomonas putida]|nr:hypothetical protein PPUJ13061_42170 [Pseudomonas putida]